jgi:hypothetical protein
VAHAAPDGHTLLYGGLALLWQKNRFL